MPFSIERYPFELTDIGEWLLGSISLVDKDSQVFRLESSEHLHLIGPFPSYYLDPRVFVATGPELAHQSGWRALAMVSEEPVALVDITITPAGKPRYAVRGKNAAKAFRDALMVVAKLSSNEDYDVRWFSLADIYVTALWLRGTPEQFVPTRLGNSERIAPRVTELQELQAIAKKLIEHATNSRLTEFYSRDVVARVDTGRSGLPDDEPTSR